MKPILVISHPRSGTHFLINTISLNFGLTHEVINLPSGNPSAFLTNSWTEPEKIRKSHHQAWWLTQPDLQELTERYSVFYVIRDYRAVFVSMFHYFNGISPRIRMFPHYSTFPEMLKSNPIDYPWDAAYSKVRASTYPELWMTHIDSWQPWFNRLCVVSYEDLSLRFEQTVWRTSAFLKRMPVGQIQRPALKAHSVSPYRGLWDGWKDELTQRLSMKIWRQVKRHRHWLME